jgi:tRNA pseudouridine13 synthase
MAPSEQLGPEREIGLEVYFTGTQGVGGALKRTAEDFVVEELSAFPEPDENGRYTVAKVTSTDWETNRLVRQLAHALAISRSRITFAGTKDKRAVTAQLMSFEAPLEAVRGIRIKDVEIGDAYRSRKHLTLGDLVGNRFRIWLRGCAVERETLAAAIGSTEEELARVGGFPNFFGVQRFGSLRPVTHLVGRHIVKGDLRKACMAYAGSPNPDESYPAREARRRLDETEDFEAALADFPRALSFERAIIAYMAQNPGDYAGAIRSLPPNLQMMFVHAYQSFLFNRVLSERIRRGLPLNEPLVGDIVLPTAKDGLPDHEKPVPVTRLNLDLVAPQVRAGRAYVSGVLFGSESRLAEGEMGAIERAVLESEGLSPSDFVVPSVPECSSKGSRREIIARYWDFSCSAASADALFQFSLGRGCYATSFLREFTKADLIDSDRRAHREGSPDAGDAPSGSQA